MCSFLASNTCEDYPMEPAHALFLLSSTKAQLASNSSMIFAELSELDILHRVRWLSDSTWIAAIDIQRLQEADQVLLTRLPYLDREILLAGQKVGTKQSTPALTIQLDQTQQQQQQSIYLNIDGDLYIELLSELTGAKSITLANRDPSVLKLRTRYTYADQHKQTVEYLSQYFKSLDLEVVTPMYQLNELTPFPSLQISAPSSSSIFNVVARLRGEVEPDEWVIIGAHFDSTSERPLQLAPGAVDDGSGTAAVMTLASAIANLGPQRRSIIFCTFSGEEQGLLGSKAFVKHLQAGDSNLFSSGNRKPIIKAAILMDMISYSRRSFGVKIEGTPDASIRKLMAKLADSFRLHSPELTIEQSLASFGSDHVSFQRAGYPAVLLIEADDTNYPNYHKSTDIVNTHNVNISQCVGIMRGLLNTALDYANTINIY
jgi:hypothetical protein